MTKPTTLSENVMQDNQFFIEGLTQYLTEQIYPSDKGSVYVANVKMIELLCDLIGKKQVLGDFLQGNVNSIEKYFNAQTWEGKYVGNFADFLKYTTGYFENSETSKSYYLFREINKNYKGAIKCITKAYYDNLMKDSKMHSAEEFMRLFDFCIDFCALPECYPILKQIANSGKIENIENQKHKIEHRCKMFEYTYQNDKFRLGGLEVEKIYGDDCINFVLTLGKKNKLNIRFDGVDGFDISLNNHSETYLQEKARKTKFADGSKAKDMALFTNGNFEKIVFYDKDGQELHTIGINYGHKKNMTFDDEVVNLDFDNYSTEKDEIL